LRLGPPNFSGSQFRECPAREIFAAKENGLDGHI